MKFNVVTPTGSVIDTDVEVTVPGALGEFNVLPERVLQFSWSVVVIVLWRMGRGCYTKGGIVEIGRCHCAHRCAGR